MTEAERDHLQQLLRAVAFIADWLSTEGHSDLVCEHLRKIANDLIERADVQMKDLSDD